MTTADIVQALVALFAEVEDLAEQAKAKLDQMPALFQAINEDPTANTGLLIAKSSSLRAKAIGLGFKAAVWEFHSDMTDAARARGIDIPSIFSGWRQVSAIDWSLLIAALIVGAASWRMPRAILWLVCAGIDFAVSTLYWRTGLPYAEGVAGFCDVGVCLAVYFRGQERWEMWIWRLFQTSVAINLLYLAGNIGVMNEIPNDVYSILLELINWLMLLLIGGMGVAQLLGASLESAHRPWTLRSRVRLALYSLRRQRSSPPFHKVR